MVHLGAHVCALPRVRLLLCTRKLDPFRHCLQLKRREPYGNYQRTIKQRARNVAKNAQRSRPLRDAGLAFTRTALAGCVLVCLGHRQWAILVEWCEMKTIAWVFLPVREINVWVGFFFPVRRTNRASSVSGCASCFPTGLYALKR